MRGVAAAALVAAACAPDASDAPDDRGPGDEAGGATTGRESSPGVNEQMRITPEGLAARRERPDLVALHVGADREAYARGHIPGAQFLALESITRTRDGVPNELPPVAALDSVFESVGVTDEARVVVYGEPLAAARAFFTLDVLGHGDRTAVLDGGAGAWREAGRRLSTATTPPDRGTFTPQPGDERVVDAAWVEAHRDDPDVALIDVRPEREYTGRVAGGSIPRAGHIPGAENIFWQRMIVSEDQPVLRDPETLRTLLRAAGVDNGDTVVTYCVTGVQSSFAYYVARYLGYDARLYDGSFLDWSRREELPVARGGAAARAQPAPRRER